MRIESPNESPGSLNRASESQDSGTHEVRRMVSFEHEVINALDEYIAVEIDNSMRKTQAGYDHEREPVFIPQPIDNTGPLLNHLVGPGVDFKSHSENDLILIQNGAQATEGFQNHSMKAITDGERFDPPGNRRVDGKREREILIVKSEAFSDEEPDTEEPQQKRSKRDHFTPVKYGVNNFIPSSGLIRNGVKPHDEDFTADAQIYRVAAGAGSNFDFTFSQHWNILYESLLGSRIGELNGKLVAGLDQIYDMPLLREIPQVLCAEQNLKEIMTFSKQGMQQSIDWRFCLEHFALLEMMDMGKPNLDLEEMDRLVKATGRWMLKDS